MTAYEKLKDRYAQIKNLSNASSILAKDMQTIMTKGSTSDRMNQMMAIDSVCHTLIADPKVEEWLNEAESSAGDLLPDDRRNLSLMRRGWIHSAGLPADLAKERARLEAEGQNIHDKYYRSGDWNAIKDWYAQSFKVMREVGQAKQVASERSGNQGDDQQERIQLFKRGEAYTHRQEYFTGIDGDKIAVGHTFGYGQERFAAHGNRHQREVFYVFDGRHQRFS